MPTWPTALPQYLDVQGFSTELADNLIRSSMDVGRDKTRQRDVSATEPVIGTLLLTLDQRADLKTFYNVVLGSGSLEFDWIDPITGDPAIMKFTAPPKFTAVGPVHLRASLALEIIP